MQTLQLCGSRRSVRLLAIVGALTFLFAADTVVAAEYYVAKDGDDANPGSSSQPWRTISHGGDQVEAGDTLWIDDGTYRDRLRILKSGTSSSRITIKAINDGEVTIDGEYQRKAAALHGDYLTIEGIVFTQGGDDTINMSGSHNILRRISAYRSDPGGNNHVLAVVGQYNLLEDVAAGGAAANRHVVKDYNANGRRQHNTYRRVFAAGHQLEGTENPSSSEFNIYGSSNVIIENCIGWGGTTVKSIAIHSRWNTPDRRSVDNKVLGSIFLRSKRRGGTIGYGYDSYDTVIEHTIFAYNGESGIGIWAGHDQSGEMLENITTIGNGEAGIEGIGRGNTSLDFTVKNSVVTENQSGFSGVKPTSLTYTNSYGNAQSDWPGNQGPNCISKDPGFRSEVPLSIPSNSPCKGSGEGGGDMGANIQYRYVDGELTDEPLWPWPMQDRIEDELGIDVTGELEPMLGLLELEATARPPRGGAELEVKFEAEASGGTAPYTYVWEFGDDSESASGDSVMHTYTESGNYTATVTATDADDNTRQQTVAVEVADPSEISFSPIEYYGSFLNWEPRDRSRWEITEFEGDRRLYLGDTELDADGDKVGGYALVKDRVFGDFEMTFEAKSNQDLEAVKHSDWTVVFGYQDSENYYYLLGNHQHEYSVLYAVEDGERTEIARADRVLLPDNDWHDVRIEREGSDMRVELDGEEVLTASDTTYGEGRIGVGSYNDTAYFDNIDIAGPGEPEPGEGTDAGMADTSGGTDDGGYGDAGEAGDANGDAAAGASGSGCNTAGGDSPAPPWLPLAALMLVGGSVGMARRRRSFYRPPETH